MGVEWHVQQRGATVTVTHKTVPIEISVRTPWGAVKVPPITFAGMPGSDDVVLFGVATMKALGLDLYPWALDCLLYTSPSPRDLSTSRMPSSA